MRKPTQANMASAVKRWEPFARGTAGSKVLIEHGLILDSPLYHLLEAQWAEMILNRSTLRLSPIKSWPDPYESWWCRRIFERHNSPLSGVNAYAICWTTNSFHEPVWRMVGYGRNNPIVRLKVTARDLLNAAKSSIETQPGSWFLERVDYCREKTLVALADNLAQTRGTEIDGTIKDVGRNAAALLLKKRVAFKFESEVRLVFLDRNGASQKSEIFLPIANNAISQIMTSPHNKAQHESVANQLGKYGTPVLRSKVLDEPP